MPCTCSGDMALLTSLDMHGDAVLLESLGGRGGSDLLSLSFSLLEKDDNIGERGLETCRATEAQGIMTYRKGPDPHWNEHQSHHTWYSEKVHRTQSNWRFNTSKHESKQEHKRYMSHHRLDSIQVADHSICQIIDAMKTKPQ